MQHRRALEGLCERLEERGERTRRVGEVGRSLGGVHGSKARRLELTHWVHDAGFVIDYSGFALRLRVGSGLVWARVVQ